MATTLALTLLPKAPVSACDIIGFAGMPQKATYAYCIVHRNRRPSTARVPAGLPGATRPELLDVESSLWLVVADVPLDRYGSGPLEGRLRDLNWVAEVAVAHEAVVEYFTRQAGATVVPMKLFTIFSDHDRVVEDVGAKRHHLADIIDRIRGCEEWGVRVNRGASAVSRAVATVRPASGTAFLAARKQARDNGREAARHAAAAAAETFEALSRFARESTRRDEAPQGAASPPLLDAAFLVPVSRKASFRSAARRAAANCRAAGTELTLTGPWPPYNFIGRTEPT